MTYNQIKEKFRLITVTHNQINSFGFGQLPEFGASDELIYPVMWVVPNQQGSSISTTDKKIILKYSVILADLVHKDDSNLDEVHSDMIEIAQDVKAMLESPINEDDFLISSNSPLELFVEGFDDQVAGVTMGIDFELNYLSNRCVVPTT